MLDANAFIARDNFNIIPTCSFSVNDFCKIPRFFHKVC